MRDAGGEILKHAQKRRLRSGGASASLDLDLAPVISFRACTSGYIYLIVEGAEIIQPPKTNSWHQTLDECRK